MPSILILRRIQSGATILLLAIAPSIFVSHSLRAQARGQIRPRPAEGRQPDLPLPNIREYKPKSTLVVPAHPVPRAKFPVVDIHSHHPTPISQEMYKQVVKAMDERNIKVIVNLSGGWGDRLRQGLEAIKNSPYPDRMVLFANVDFSNIGPGSGERAAKLLEANIKAGAKEFKVFATTRRMARASRWTTLNWTPSGKPARG